MDVYRGDAAFGFTLTSTLDVPVYVSDLYLEDLNGDGHRDLFVGAYSLKDSPEGGAPQPLVSRVWLGDGQGGFTPGAALDLYGSTLLLRDVDGDGALDALSPDALCLGNGDGSFGPPELLPSAGAFQIELADLDADGQLDLLYLGDGVNVARGAPGGVFLAPERITSSSGWLSFGVGQWAGSSALDLLAVHLTSTDSGESYELMLVENGTAPSCGQQPR